MLTSGNKDIRDTKSWVDFCCDSSCLLLLLQFWVARAAEKCQMSEAPIADPNLVLPELGTDILDVKRTDCDVYPDAFIIIGRGGGKTLWG